MLCFSQKYKNALSIISIIIANFSILAFVVTETQGILHVFLKFKVMVSSMLVFFALNNVSVTLSTLMIALQFGAYVFTTYDVYIESANGNYEFLAILFLYISVVMLSIIILLYLYENSFLKQFVNFTKVHREQQQTRTLMDILPESVCIVDLGNTEIRYSNK